MDRRMGLGRGGWLAGLLAFLGLGSVSVTSAAPLRILPLGDSLTYGLATPAPVPGGYRAQLFRDLTAAGYDPLFVGNSILNPDPTLPPASSPHEGHVAFLIDGLGGLAGFSLNTYIGQWLAPGNGIEPDYILLMAGANHSLGNYQLAGGPYDLAALITRISELRPTAKILVSTLTPQGTAALESQVEQFNKTLGGPTGLIAQLAKLGENVTLVDVGSALTPADLSDYAHPNAGGYKKLGDAWFRAIQANNLVAAPEPSTLTLLGVGVVAWVAASRSRKTPSPAD